MESTTRNGSGLDMASEHDDISIEEPSLLDKLIAQSADTWKPCGKPVVIDLYPIFEERLLKALGLPHTAVPAKRTRKRRRHQETEEPKPENRTGTPDSSSTDEEEKVRRDKRYKYSDEQRSVLEKVFAQAQYPSTQEKIKASSETGIAVKNISSWFKNRRKRQMLRTPVFRNIIEEGPQPEASL
uniref:Homeobox domain-containing protein n=1 Tax=Steinernema glaseri TaxID=37863 RepID=A0A1I7Y513_9BILA